MAKSGIKPKPLQEGSCLDVNRLRQQIKSGEPVKFRGRRSSGTKAGKIFLDAYGMSVSNFCDGPLSTRLDPVIDKTGVAGRFDFYFEFSPG